jgi:DNA modification methylase
VTARAGKSPTRRPSKPVAKPQTKRVGKKAAASHARERSAADLPATRANGTPRGEAAVWVAVGALVPWAGNPKKPTKAEIAGVAASIRKFGFGAPMVARKANREIIAGHTRLLAAKKEGLAEVPVRYLDLSERDAHVLALADNELGADWDGDMLKEQLALLDAEDRLLAGFIDKAPMPDGEDNVPPVPKKAKSKAGERYELGPHVLVCGDSTDANVWQLLLGGALLKLIWTDPPYGVSYEAKNEHLRQDGRSARPSGSTAVSNDSLTPQQLGAFLEKAFACALGACAKGASWYVASPPGSLLGVFGDALTAIGVWKHTLMWLKDSFVIGRADYHYRHEPILYGWEPSGPHYWCGSRKFDSVLEFPRPRKSPEHPTMKPPELIQVCIENSTKPDDLVGDPFGGSGSTLIAAARTGRRARLIELDPAYCDVIRKRWGDFARTAGVELGSGAL